MWKPRPARYIYIGNRNDVSYPAETNLEKIALLANLRRQQNEHFRRFLKGKNSTKVDAIVHRLNNEVSATIDCTQCGQCCKTRSPELSVDDKKILAERLNMPAVTLKELYLETDEQGHESFKHLPCAFLHNNCCTVYEHRPGSCRSFPHLHLPGFTHRLRSVFDNYAICPIVFNVIERLKDEPGFYPPVDLDTEEEAEEV